MPRIAHIAADSLGQRIRKMRKERGWTQSQLAAQSGCSKRAIHYYEHNGRYPPTPILAAMAQAFGITIEALLHETTPEHIQDKDSPDLFRNSEDRRLWRKFQQLRDLPIRDQKAVFRMINSLSEKHQPE